MARLCVFGDSITWGAWDLEVGGWVNRLRLLFNRLEIEGKFDLGVYNFGVGGDRVVHLAPRIGVECSSTEPDAIIIAIGINDSAHDGLPATEPDVFVDSYTHALSIALQFTPEIILLGLTNVDEKVASSWSNESISMLNDKIRDLAAEAGLTFVDPFGQMLAEDLVPDGLHPSASGHQKIFDLVLRELMPASTSGS